MRTRCVCLHWEFELLQSVIHFQCVKPEGSTFVSAPGAMVTCLPPPGSGNDDA